MPSIVLTSCPSASRPSIRHDRIERPSTSTAHVPHSPSSQPCFVPVRLRSSRKTSSSVLCGAKATSTCSPLSVNPICFLLRSGTVFLLHLVQNCIVDESRLADIRGDSDQRWPFVYTIDPFKCFSIGDCHVIESRARLRFHGRANHFSQTPGTALAFLKSGLCLDERAMNHCRGFLFVRRQVQITRRDRQSRILAHDRQ